jgi:hypothetical protein
VPERVPAAFLAVLADLTGWLEGSRIPAVVIGGVAAAILGRPRATRDIDSLAILPENEWSTALASAAKHGLVPRVDQPLEFARRTRVLLLRHADSAIDIDVILGRLPFEEEVVARAQVRDLSGVSVRLPQVEDLIIMKAIAQRPHDLRDIEGLLDAHPDADVNRVRSWVREFSTAMTMPDILDGLEKLLAQRR